MQAMVLPNTLTRTQLPRLEVRLPDLQSNPYLLEARRRLEHLRSVDLARPLSRRAALFSSRRAEAQRWRLAEAWRHAQATMQDFERQLHARAVAAGPPTAETFRALVLTHYCANILRVQAAFGHRTGVPARPVPAEWMHLAAAAAIVSVAQTALLLWVLHHQPAPPPAAPRVRRHSPPPLAAPVHAYVAPRAVSLPLRL
jgi:hypothetical protein